MSATRTNTVPVWVVGASGLLSGELLRLLEGHGGLALEGVVSRSDERGLAVLQPHLAATDAPLVTADAAPAALSAALSSSSGPLALVLGLPHGEAARFWRDVRAELGPAAERVRVVDLSADYRLRDPGTYAHWYGSEHADPDELERFVYGLPEWNRAALCEAKRAAAPGCFATAMQLATLPAARAGLADPERPWTLFAVTGSSGSGNAPKPTTHHPHRHGNLWAYGLQGHRHEAELAQALAPLGPVPPICFLPHSGPFARGIHLTAALPLREAVDRERVLASYVEAYGDEPFVEVLAEGVPDLRRVAGSNRAALAVEVRAEVLTVLLTLDNVVKGGAGQALQCLNAMLGFEEERGLPRAGLGVC